MTNWQKKFDNLGNNPGTINYLSLTPRQKKIIKHFISTLLKSQAKKIEIWARKNKSSEEMGEVVGLGQLIEKLNKLK